MLLVHHFVKIKNFLLMEKLYCTLYHIVHQFVTEKNSYKHETNKQMALFNFLYLCTP